MHSAPTTSLPGSLFPSYADVLFMKDAHLQSPDFRLPPIVPNIVSPTRALLTSTMRMSLSRDVQDSPEWLRKPRSAALYQWRQLSRFRSRGLMRRRRTCNVCCCDDIKHNRGECPLFFSYGIVHEFIVGTRSTVGALTGCSLTDSLGPADRANNSAATTGSHKKGASS